jgi:hypothetical protein
MVTIVLVVFYIVHTAGGFIIILAYLFVPAYSGTWRDLHLVSQPWLPGTLLAVLAPTFGLSRAYTPTGAQFTC